MQNGIQMKYCVSVAQLVEHSTKFVVSRPMEHAYLKNGDLKCAASHSALKWLPNAKVQL